jgi:hypothetical protein
MTSFATAGAGLKAPTSMPQRNTCQYDYRWGDVLYAIGCSEIAYTGGYTFQELVNVNGSGVINFLVFGGSASSTFQDMVVNIDGVEVYNVATTGSIEAYGLACVGGYNYVQVENQSVMSTGSVPFNTNLTVTCRCNAVAGLAISYYLTS